MEGPKIEKMLGYTNLESEKGFAFLPEVPEGCRAFWKSWRQPGIEEGDTVRMYGFEFDYYK